MRKIRIPHTRPMEGTVTYTTVAYINADDENHIVHMSSDRPIDYDDLLEKFRPFNRVWSLDYVQIGKDTIEISRN